LYLGIGYLHRNYEDPSVCLFMGHNICKPTEMSRFRIGCDIGFCVNGTEFRLLI